MFDLSTIHINPENPYPSKSDTEFQDLCDKIRKYPKFLSLRPIVYDPSTMMILGGNKRYAALIDLGHKSVSDKWVVSADELTEEEKKKFIYADNKNYGEYDIEFVDEDMAEEWGVEFESDDAVHMDDIDTQDGFNLPDGDREPFQQMTFTLADEQAEYIKNAMADIKKTDEYKYMETMGNENGNGNALYLLVTNALKPDYVG